MKTQLAGLCLLTLMIVTADPVTAAEISAQPDHKVTIVLVGDSTVTANSGWGAGFEQCLNDNVECVNTAQGGSTTITFLREGRWTNALALKGDYYLIQFAHNHEPPKGGGPADMDTFIKDLQRYVDDARSIGAKPVLVTPLSRRQWDKANPGKIKSSLTPYADEMRKIADENNIPLVELHERSRALYETLGKERCLEFSPLKTVNGRKIADHTHLNEEGGGVFGQVVAEELAWVVPELAGCIKTSSPAPPPTGTTAKGMRDPRPATSTNPTSNSRTPREQ